MKTFSKYTVPVAVFIIRALFPTDCLAQWATDPHLNNPVCTLVSNQEKTAIAPDGFGGAYIVWLDGRVSDPDIYAQHMDATGAVKWAVDGIPVCDANDYQVSPVIIPDGNGGAIITWADFRNGLDYNIYAQHLDVNGQMLWGANGKVIHQGAGDQTHPVIASDGEGGAIIAWLDQSLLVARDFTIQAERIAANGQTLWGISSAPVILTDTVGTKSNPAIISDGNGGAIVAWTDFRSYYNGNTATDIYAQRVDGTGAIKWSHYGTIVCKAEGNEDFPTLVSVGRGGAIITWQDKRDDVDQNIYAQRMSIDGLALWTKNGIMICDAVKDQTYPVIVSDQSGGVIIAWNDMRNFGGSVIYAQRVNGNGITQWVSNGYYVSGGDSNSAANIVTDGQGGAIIACESYSNLNSDIYATHVDKSSDIVWTSVISNADGSQKIPMLVPDNSGGAIITWEDYRAVDNIDTYAQHVKANGALGNSTFTGQQDFSESAVSVYPNPVVNDLFIDVSSLSLQEPVEVTLLDLAGRKLKTTSGKSVIRINMTEYKASSYIVKIVDGKQVTVKKIIKN